MKNSHDVLIHIIQHIMIFPYDILLYAPKIPRCLKHTDPSRRRTNRCARFLSDASVPREHIEADRSVTVRNGP